MDKALDWLSVLTVLNVNALILLAAAKVILT